MPVNNFSVMLVWNHRLTHRTLFNLFEVHCGLIIVTGYHTGLCMNKL